MLQRMRRGHVLPFALASLVTVGGISTSSVYAYPARHRVEAKDLIPAPETAVDRAKRAAARRAVDHYVKDGMAIGVGSGSTIVYAIQRLAERFHGPEKDLHDIVCIPTSFQSRQVCHLKCMALDGRIPSLNLALVALPAVGQLLSEAGLPLGDLTSYPELDVAIDGADEVDRALNCIKGGGACQTQEKMVAAAARTFVVVADHRKQSECLGREWRKGVPLEVIPEGYRPVLLALEAMGAKPVLRMATAKAGPVVTDNGA